MRSRRLQILITLMFVTMMFVQTPAQTGTNATLIKTGSNTNVNDYQKDNQFSFGKTSSVETTSSTSNLNGITKVSSVNSNLGIYNQSGTVMQSNSTYYHPGQFVNVNFNSSQISNYNYTNAFTYQLMSQDGATPIYNNTITPISNTTTQTTTDITQTYNTQTLSGSETHNSTSVSDIYGVSISAPTPTNITPTTVEIQWSTVGNTTSTVSYGTQNATLLKTAWQNSVTVDGFRNSHIVYLNSLTPNTKYYYQIYGTDYFGRVIKSSTFMFFSQPVTATPNQPTISSVTVSAVNPTNATVTFASNTPVNYTLKYGPTRAQVATYSSVPISTTAQTNPSILITSALLPGTQYFFEVIAYNNTFSTTDNNNGNYYTFTTLPNSFALSKSPTYIFNTTSSEVNITFSTNSAVNASVYYSLDPYFSTGTVQHTNYDNAGMFHQITIPMLRAVKYFYYINITTGTSSYIIMKSFTSNTFPGFSFTTPKASNQDVNLAQFNFSFKLPTYPATLGSYQFKLSFNQTIKAGVSYPSSTTNRKLDFSVVFLVNDTLLFTQHKVLVQRGTYTNGTGTYPIWMNDLNSTYSPTENLLFIGTVAYNTSPTNFINSSDITTGGLINLYFNGKQISVGSNNIYDAPGTSLKINSSLLPSTNPAITKILNVHIPAKDIYGNMTVQMGVTFSHAQNTASWASDYTQYTNFTNPLDVKYRLELINSTGGGSYYLTATHFNGSATILPVSYTNVEKVYPNGNQSNFLKIPTSEINLTLSVTLNGTPQNIFEFSANNYTWYWTRATLESTLKTGSYTLKLLWNDGPEVAVGDSVYSSSPTPFVNHFSLNVQFTVKDLSYGISVVPGNNVKLQFKIIVPQTKVAWDQNLNATVDGKAATYDPITGQYSVLISVPSTATDGNVTVTVKLASEPLVSNTLFYKISSQPDVSVSSGASTVNTKSVTDEHVSLIGFGLLGVGLIVTVIYAGFVLITLRRK